MMKVITTLVALATFTIAHYNYPSMILNGVTTPQWDSVRQWTNYESLSPVTDVTIVDIRCNVGASTNFAPTILSVPAGSLLGFDVFPTTTGIYHPGPLLAYMAKVPPGYTAANWDGSGTVWFKIFELGASFSPGEMNWAELGENIVNFTIPADVPSGDYLFRIEQIGLHVAYATGGAQFYISCGQITVTGGGSGTPGPLVAFPGAYSATDPGLLLDIYYPIPTNYTIPGPPVWTGGSASTGPTSTPSGGGTTRTTTSSAKTTATSSGKTTTGKTTTGKLTTSRTTVATTTTSTKTGATVPEYGQCGGQGWTGGTVCASPYTCSVLNPYYSQCV